VVVREHTVGNEPDYLCIPQTQHAALAGQLARAWGNLDFPAPAPRQATCLAAELHDNGMDPFDEAPELDPDSGLPRDFMHMPLGRWIECWERGPRQVGAENPYAGLLVSMHGLHLLEYRRKADLEEDERVRIEEFERDQRSLQEELRASAAAVEACEPHLGEAALEANRKLLEVWDAFSLALCMPRVPESFGGVPGEAGGATLRIKEVGTIGSGPVVIEVDPWPFSAERVPLAVAGRLLGGPRSDQAELDQALAGARFQTLEFELLPREQDGLSP